MTKEEIKAKRLDKGLTQQDLAVKLDITPRTVSRWELGVSKPSKVFITLMKIILQ